MKARGLLIFAALLALCAPTLASACEIGAAPLAFGSINPLDASNYDSVARITVTCPTETSYTVSIDSGAGGFGTRAMIDGTHTLAYQVYTDAGRSQVWGDGTMGTSVISGSAGLSGAVHTLYGRIPAQYLAAPGIYTDVLTIIVTY